MLLMLVNEKTIMKQGIIKASSACPHKWDMLTTAIRFEVAAIVSRSYLTSNANNISVVRGNPLLLRDRRVIKVTCKSSELS